MMRKPIHQSAFATTSLVVMAAVMIAGLGVWSAPFAQRPRPDGTLVVATANAIELVSPSTGAVTRTVPIPDTYVLALDASSPDSQMAVSPDGKMAYVAVKYRPRALPVNTPTPEILAVPLDGGRPRVAATDAVAPALSSDGGRLAYLEDTVPPGSTIPQRTSETVMVLNLKSRTREAFDLRAAYLEANGPVAVNGLSWSPSGATLAVSAVEFADVYGSFDSVVLLDPAAPVNPEANPKLLRVRTMA